MKKYFNRVLAMLLTLVTLLTVLPISALADGWLDVEGETNQNGNVTSSEITVTITAKALLSYIKNRDLKGLLAGISVSGLRDAVSADELFEIIPKENFQEIIDLVQDDIDPKMILDYISLDELLKSVDKDALIDLVKGIDNIQDYVKDGGYSILMDKYISGDDLADAIEYINVDKLAKDYSDKLLDLALGLSDEKLLGIVNVDAVMELKGIDFESMINGNFFKNDIGYENLFDNYVDQDALAAYIEAHLDEWNEDILREYVNEHNLKALFQSKIDDENIGPDVVADYINTAAIQTHLGNYTSVYTYAILKEKRVISEDAIIALFKNGGYDSLNNYGYINETKAKEYLTEKFPISDFAECYEGGVLNLSKLFDLKKDQIDFNYLIAQNIIHVDSMLFDKRAGAPYTVTALIDAGAISIPALINSGLKGLDIVSLEEAGILTYQLLIFGNDTLEPLFTPSELLKAEGLYLEGMLNGKGSTPALFTIEDLYHHNVVKKDALVAAYGYDKLADIAKLKNAIRDRINDNTLSANDVLDCLNKKDDGTPNYKAAIDAIGGMAVVNKEIVSYETVLNTYVTDFDGLLNKLGIDAIIQKILDNNDLENIFDVNGLIDAIGIGELAKLVDLPSVIRQLYQNGGLTAIVKSLTPKNYLVALNNIYSDFMDRLCSLSINGVVVTETRWGMVYFNPEKLLGAIQAMIPTLNDLANLDDDGVVFQCGFSLTYISATTGEEKTKAISASVKLNGGVEEIRSLAGKAETLLNKIVSYSYNNGNLSLQLKVPTAFANVIREVLQTLGSSADPDLVAIKDQLLDLYGKNISDMGVLIENLTLDQLTTLLEKVDTDQFTAAYNKVMQIRYVEIVLNIIERATGYDLSGVSLDEIVNKLDNLPTIPTFDAVAQKVQDVTGYDILAKLPARIEGIWETAEGELITDLISKLAKRVGVDVDVQAVLEEATASGDPINYLYTKFTESVSTADAVYSAAKERVLYVIYRITDSRFGPTIKEMHLGDLYRGNGVFGYGKAITLDLNKIIERGVDKIISVVTSRVDIDADLVEGAKSVLLGMFVPGECEIDLGVDLSLWVKGMYKVEFLDETGKQIDEYFLPRYTDLVMMQGEYTPANPDHLFLGWKDADGVIYQSMPAKDVVLMPEIEDGCVDITVYDPADFSVITIIKVPEGSSLSTIKEQLTNLAIDNSDYAEGDTLQWYVVKDGKLGTELDLDADQALTQDMGVTWKLTKAEVPATYVTITLYDTDLTTIKYTVDVLQGSALADIKDQLMQYVTGYETGDTLQWFLVEGGALGAELDLDTAVADDDMGITWKVTKPTEPPVYHEVSIIDPYNNNNIVATYWVESGKSLIDAIPEADLNALFTEKTGKNLVPAWYQVDRYFEFDQTDVYDISAPVIEDFAIAWKYYTVTVYSTSGQTAGMSTGSVEVGRDTAFASINDTLMRFTDARADFIPAWYLYEYGMRGEHYDNNSMITWDLDLTWHYPSITVQINGFDANGAPKTWTVIDSVAVTYGTDLQAWILERDNYTVEDYVKAAYLRAMYDYHKEWNYNGVTSVVDDVTVVLNFKADLESATLYLRGDSSKFTFECIDQTLIITWNDNNWDDVMELVMETDIINFCADHQYAISLRSKNGSYAVVMDPALMAAMATALGNSADAVTLKYALDTGKTSSENVKYFSFEFISTVQAISDGDFFGAGTVTISYPHKTLADPTQKTIIKVDGVVYENLFVDHALEGVTVFTAPHFSEFVIIDTFSVGYAPGIQWNMNAQDIANLGLPTNWTVEQVILGQPILPGFYEYGQKLTFGAVTFQSTYANGLYAAFVQNSDVQYREGDELTITGPVELTHYVNATTYTISYYIPGATGNYGDAVYTYNYTKWTQNLPGWEALLKAEGFDIQLNGAAIDYATYAWVGAGENAAQTLYDYPGNYMLFLVNTNVATETYKFHFTYNNKEYTSDAFTVTEWISEQLALIEALANNNMQLPAGIAELVVWTYDGKALSEITLGEWATIFAENTTGVIEIQGKVDNRKYTVYAGSNVLELQPGTQLQAGESVSFKVLAKPGMIPTVVIEYNGAEFTLTAEQGVYTFNMPHADVTISVSYAKETYSYVDKDGNTVTGRPYGDKVTYDLVIPGNYWVDATALDAFIAGRMTLEAAKANEDGNLVLTYFFLLNENTADFNLQVFDAEAQKYVSELEYLNVYVVNGKHYATEAEALAACPEGVTVKWEVGAYKNMFIASFEAVEEDGIAGLIWLIVILVLIILILVIALLYILYINGVLKPNWFLRFITAIVSGFFAVCMAVAAGALAIARLFGYKEEDMMEETIEIPSNQEPEVDPVSEDEADAATIAQISEDVDSALAAEEATEEATEEAEETAEETAPEANQAAVVEDAVEVEVEDIVSEAEEAPVEEATEATEEATVAAVEAAVAEAMEEVISDVDEVAPEAVEAEVANEVSEEAAEEVTEEATEEISTEISEETAEEATEETTEEATEEETEKNETNE